MELTDTTMWELASQDIYNGTYGYDFVGTGESGYLQRNLRIRLCGNWRVRIFTAKLTDTTLWELASQYIYDETYGYVFPCKSFDNKHTLFNSELHFSINVDRLSTPLTKTDY
jgi:hypothetical protein